MTYMMMLVLENAEQLASILDAWQGLPLDGIMYVESTCARSQCAPRVHIPIRFMFEPLGAQTESCTLTLFALAPDEATVNECIEEVEAIIGDLDRAPMALLAAWPLPIVRGYPKRTGQGDS